MFAELECDYGNQQAIADMASQSEYSPRKTFGVKDWEVFVCGIFGTVSGETEMSSSATPTIYDRLRNHENNDEIKRLMLRVARFEAVVWLFCRYFFLAQPLPKKAIAREEWSRTLQLVMEDTNFGLNNSTFTGKRRTGRKRPRAELLSDELILSRLKFPIDPLSSINFMSSGVTMTHPPTQNLSFDMSKRPRIAVGSGEIYRGEHSSHLHYVDEEVDRDEE